MKKVLILYVSTTGNTRKIAHLLKGYLDSQQFDITIEEIGFQGIDMNKLYHFDGLLIGTYTYDDGDFPHEIEDFYNDLESVQLVGKVVGCFGSGDTSYMSFCDAVDLMKNQFVRTNATIIEHTVKVDRYPDEAHELLDIQNLANQFATALT